MKKFFLFLFVFVLNCQFSIVNSQLNTKETKLATIPEDYQEVSKIVFSANGQRVAYKVQKDGKEFVVVGSPAGEKAGKPYERVAMDSLFLSPDGQRVAYDARRGEKKYLVLASPPPVADGEKEGRPYDNVSPTTFSPDGSLVVCQVEEGRKWFVMVTDGDKETFHSPHYDMSHIPPVFSPDSRLVFYVLEDRGKGKQTIFATDVHTAEVKKARTYAWIGGVKLSVNGLRFAYPAKKEKEGKVFLVLNDLASDEEKEGPPYDWIGARALSPDGQRVAYVARKDLPADLSAEARAKVEASAQAGGKQFLVVSNWNSPSKVKENGPYDGVGTPVFSPDGSQVAYVARKEGKQFVVLGDKEGKLYDYFGILVFAPDSSKIAYPASKDGRWFVVSGASDGSLTQEGPAYDMVVAPIFSPDGSKIVYRARRGEGERFIVVGHLFGDLPMRQVEGPICDEVWQPVLSPDGKSVCYGARIGRELWWKTQLLP